MSPTEGTALVWRNLRRNWFRFGLLWAAGIAVGLAAVGFAWFVDWCYEQFTALHDRWAWWPFLIAPAGGALVVYATRRWFDGAEGSGIPQVIAAMDVQASPAIARLVSLRVAVGKVLLGGIAIFSGFSAGREGPTVQVGAALAWRIGALSGATHPGNLRHLLAAGGAAGVAAAFNTPLAGVVFAIEELARSFEHRTNGATIAAVILAGLVALGLQGNYAYFGRLYVGEYEASLLVPVLVSGIVCGAAGGTFCWLLLNPQRWMPTRVYAFRTEHPVRFAAACGFVLAVLGLLAGGTTFGSGYEEARAALSGDGELPWQFAPAKFLANLLSFLSGIPGGLFAPSLSVGAGIGDSLARLFEQANPAAIGALCMAAFLAAVTQSPITAFVIVMEMIDNRGLVLSLMAAALIASGVSRAFGKPLYIQLAQRYAARFRPPEPAAASSDANADADTPSSESRNTDAKSHS